MIGVLAAMVVPTLGGSDGRKVVDAAHRLTLLVNRARQETSLSSRVWRLQLDPAETRYRFQRRQGEGFAAPERAPFRDWHPTPGLAWPSLTVNGRRAPEGGAVHLYPTGEQDSFRLTLESDGRRRTVALDPVGRARVEATQ